MLDPDRTNAILERLASIDTRLAKVDAEVHENGERLRRVEDVIGPVERLTKISELGYWRGASATLRETRTNLAEIVHDILVGLRAREATRPADTGGEPPAANDASLGRTRRRRVQVVGGSAAVALLAATLTYASWEPERAGDIRDSIVPLPAAPVIPAPAEPGPTRSPAAGDTPVPSGPAPVVVDRRPGLLAPPTRPGPASQHPPPLLLEPTGTPTADTGDDCSGLGVQVRRITVCRQRP